MNHSQSTCSFTFNIEASLQMRRWIRLRPAACAARQHASHERANQKKGSPAPAASPARRNSDQIVGHQHGVLAARELRPVVVLAATAQVLPLLQGRLLTAAATAGGAVDLQAEEVAEAQRHRARQLDLEISKAVA